MDTPVELIVGLGNPGPAYERTRHNVGADLVLNLANSHNAQFKHETKFFGDTAKINLDGKSIRLLIPSTFMNLSGKSIRALAGFYQIPTERILVVHDELDLSPGIARFKKAGGHGGHNGLRDIDRHISVDYWRVRIGIGRPPHEAVDAKSWVLADFGHDEQTGWLPTLLDAIADEANRLVEHDDGGFMSRVAFLVPPPKPIQTETQ